MQNKEIKYNDCAEVTSPAMETEQMQPSQLPPWQQPPWRRTAQSPPPLPPWRLSQLQSQLPPWRQLTWRRSPLRPVPKKQLLRQQRGNCGSDASPLGR